MVSHHHRDGLPPSPILLCVAIAAVQRMWSYNGVGYCIMQRITPLFKALSTIHGGI
jgi:hypothetical protein